MKAYNCWICKDSGLIIYNKTHNGVEYEMATKCKCMSGVKMGEMIPTISESLAIKLSEDNYKRFMEGENR